MLFYLGIFSVTQFWFWLGKRKWIKKYAKHKSGKPKPWWQDSMVIFLVVATSLMVWRSLDRTPSIFLASVSWYLLFDMLVYHVRVLWFDQYEPKKPPDALKVFSHTRVLFQAIINFIQSIFLFGILYSFHSTTSSTEKPCLGFFLQYSFNIATMRGKPENLEYIPLWLTNIHVVFSMFFLVVVISIIASVGYRRAELAPNPTQSGGIGSKDEGSSGHNT
jgi:hypothetical protein